MAGWTASGFARGHPPDERCRLDALASWKRRTALSNLSRQPGLQNPTTFPSCTVRESACTGLPDQGQVVSLMQSAMSRAGIVLPRGRMVAAEDGTPAELGSSNFNGLLVLPLPMRVSRQGSILAVATVPNHSALAPPRPATTQSTGSPTAAHPRPPLRLHRRPDPARSVPSLRDGVHWLRRTLRKTRLQSSKHRKWSSRFQHETGLASWNSGEVLKTRAGYNEFS